MSFRPHNRVAIALTVSQNQAGHTAPSRNDGGHTAAAAAASVMGSSAAGRLRCRDWWPGSLKSGLALCYYRVKIQAEVHGMGPGPEIQIFLATDPWDRVGSWGWVQVGPGGSRNRSEGRVQKMGPWDGSKRWVEGMGSKHWSKGWSKGWVQACVMGTDPEGGPWGKARGNTQGDYSSGHSIWETEFTIPCKIMR